MERPGWGTIMISRFHLLFIMLIVDILGGCATLPPGSDYPRTASSALVHPEETRLGRQFVNAALEQNGNSGFRMPFAYRGHSSLFRATEFMFNTSRLDYRMHNKLLVVDNAIALMGGRNIGDQYFQIDPDSQFADDDLFVAGPVAQQLSATFDEFWNNALSIPVEALSGGKPSHADF